MTQAMKQQDEMHEEVLLPRTFDEFNDARKASFIHVKEYKEKGGHMVGFLCSYTPLEIIDAAGVASVGLCGTSDEVIPAAEAVLPANLCPLIKSTYGFAYTDKCPFTYFSDMIVGETTCDGKKKMYELLSDLKKVYALHLPQSRMREYEREGWRKEVRLFKEMLEEFYNVEITDEKLREAVRKRNRLRRAQLSLFNLQRLDPPAISGVSIISTMAAGGFSFDVDDYTSRIEALVAQAQEAYDAGQRPFSKDAKRILMTGCPMAGVVNKVAKTIEDNGGVVVCMDDCSGERTAGMLIDEDAENILDAIADRYLSINCSVMTPNEGRIENTLSLVEKYQAAGVIEVILCACHTFNVESARTSQVIDEHDIPYLKLETDYSQGDKGQLETRIAAFIETL